MYRPSTPTRARRLVTLSAVLGHLFAAAAFADDVPPLRPAEPPYFTADLAVAVDSAARSTVTATLTVPYTELSWQRLQQGYGAAVEFAVSLTPVKRERVFGDVWEHRIVIGTYAATRSAGNNLVVSRRFDVPPGRYRASVRVRDIESEQQSSAQEEIRVADFRKIPVGFADLELGSLDSSGAFVPTPTRRFGYNVDRIAARVVLFDRRPGSWPRTYPMRLRVVDDSGAEVASGDTSVTLKHSAEPVVVRPRRNELFVGSHVMTVELVEGRSRWRVDRSFEVEESGPPRGKALEQVLESLSYIARPEEIERLRALPEDQRADGWEEFWRRRDPTPETPRNEAMLEFFRRLRYAEQHFQGFGPGWRSDMGRIYIKFGPPDQIEQRPASTQSPQLEIWYYNQPYRRFVFVDREGFGRYTLVEPANE